jgi:N-acyl-D-amino-acid deacylase
MYDILIKNGEVIDGTGKKPRAKLDVAIEKGKIVEIAADIPEQKGHMVIDATGKIVTPGFIDIQNHSDSYWTIFDQPQQTSLLSQGITTAIMGNCGSSLAPLSSAEAIKTIQKWHNLAGINLNWSTFAEFLQTLNGKIGINFGSLVGHSTLRRGLIKDEVRHATWDEIQMMDKLLSQALAQGAFGFSLGLVYAHEVNSAREELLELAKNLKARGGYLSVHLRSESGQILEALDEAIELATDAAVPLKISHLKIRGNKNWNLAEQVLGKIEQAYHKGLDITFDVYPYTSSWSVLYTYLPKWAYEGGRTEILKMILDPVQHKKILEFLKTQEYDYGKIVVATSEGNTGFIGKTIQKTASNSGVSGSEALLNVLQACSTQAVVFDHNLSEEQVEKFLASPLSVIATDGAGYTEKTPNLVHPRCFGAIPKYLSWVREKKMISWEEAIRKITSEPARILGLADRGAIAKNFVADVAIFDPLSISALASYETPYQLSSGIEQVIISGKLAYHDNKAEGLHGSVLRKM